MRGETCDTRRNPEGELQGNATVRRVSWGVKRRFFCCLSVTIAGLVLKRDRLMGIGQAIMMPLFFASNALYPVTSMPGWLQVVSRVNPLSYEVSALRGLPLGSATILWLDFLVLIVAAVAAIAAASALLGRLTR